MTLQDLAPTLEPGDYFRRRGWPVEWWARREPDGNYYIYARNDYCFAQDAHCDDWEKMLPC